MPTEHDFDSIRTPAFLLAERVQRHETENAPVRAPPWWRVFKTAGLIAFATAIGAAVLSVEDPMTLLANVTAPLIGNSAPQPGAGEPTAAIQPTAEAPVSIQSAASDESPSPSVKDAPSQHETVLAESKEPPSETIEPASEDLLAKFQAWATEKDAQTQAASAQPVQDAPVQAAKQVASNARVPHRLVQRRSHTTPVRNARAEVRPLFPKKREPRAQRAQPEPPRTSDARAQDLSTQSDQAQAPSFLPIFGPRN